MLKQNERRNFEPCPVRGCPIVLPKDTFAEWESDGFLIASFCTPTAMPRHEHSSIQLSFPVSGSFLHALAARQSTTLTTGKAAFIPSGETHGTRCVELGELITINAEPEWCEENCDLTLSALRSMKTKTVDGESLLGILNSASGLLRANDRDELYLASIGVTVALGIFHHVGLQRRKGMPLNSPGPLKRVMRWIDEHISEKITLAMLASLAGCSTGHLIRLFEAYVGTTPARYLMERRLQRSRELLRDPGSDITQVALQCGFSSQSHFTRAFVQRFGDPPGAYRSKSKSIHSKLSG